MSLPLYVTLLAIVLLLGAGAVLLARGRKNKANRSEFNYRVFFIMGVAMLGIGLAELLIFWRYDTSLVIALPAPLIGIGLLYAAIGVANRDKWQSK